VEFLAPESGGDVVEIVKAALTNETPLAVNGNRTLDGLGRTVTASKGLSTRALSGVHFYEPSELVVSLGPGTTLRELTDLLDQNGQELAFEPIDYGALFGREPLSGTVGGMVAINAAGPRRIKAGAARDHMLGFTAVSGRAET
jgi:glycolate oxidase FAD binding subunit